MKKWFFYALLAGCLTAISGCASTDRQKNAEPAVETNLSDTEKQIQSIEDRLKTNQNKIRQIEYKLSRLKFKSEDENTAMRMNLVKEKDDLEIEYNYLIKELGYLKKKSSQEQ